MRSPEKEDYVEKKAKKKKRKEKERKTKQKSLCIRAGRRPSPKGQGCCLLEQSYDMSR